MRTCTHLDQIRDVAPTTTWCAGCHDLGQESWVHLRSCLTCGAVGCCDSSPYRHASAHSEATGHPLMRSIEDGESWRWCYVDLAIV